MIKANKSQRLIRFLTFCLESLSNGKFKEFGYKSVGFDDRAYEGVVPFGEVVATTCFLVILAVVFMDTIPFIGVDPHRKIPCETIPEELLYDAYANGDR